MTLSAKKNIFTLTVYPGEYDLYIAGGPDYQSCYQNGWYAWNSGYKAMFDSTEGYRIDFTSRRKHFGKLLKESPEKQKILEYYWQVWQAFGVIHNCIQMIFSGSKYNQNDFITLFQIFKSEIMNVKQNGPGMIVWVLILFLSGCFGSKQKETDNSKDTEAVSAIVDGTLLFNGENLDGWEITQFGTQGPVYVSEGSVVLGMGDGCTGITWKGDFPQVNYEVSLEARRTMGNDFFCGMTFPAGTSFCSLIVGGWGGPVVGISCIDGKDASDNFTRILKKFDAGVWYKIRLKVTRERITAWIDEDRIVDFEYPGHELYVRPEVELSKPFGVCSWMTTAELTNIVLKTTE